MGELTLVARLVLVGVFAAGLGKLADRAGARQAVGEFGVPGVLGRPLALALPLAELAVATALIPGATNRAGAAGAILLLVAFTLVVAVNLARGRTPDCHCFGQVHSRPIGAGTLIRNAVLGGLSALVLLGPDGTAGGWWADLSRAERVAAAAAGALATCKPDKQGKLICVRPFGGDMNPSQDCKCAPDAKEGDGCITARPHCGSSDNPC